MQTPQAPLPSTDIERELIQGLSSATQNAITDIGAWASSISPSQSLVCCARDDMVCVCVCVCVRERERERERERDRETERETCMFIYVYIYTHIVPRPCRTQMCASMQATMSEGKRLSHFFVYIHM